MQLNSAYRMCEHHQITFSLIDKTLGAVISAAGAIVAVFAVDWIRSRRKARREIPSRLRMDIPLIENRIAGIATALLPDPATGVRVINVGMRFDTESIKRLSSEAFDNLTQVQRMGLANIVFAMEEADGANAGGLTKLGSSGTDVDNFVVVKLHEERILLVRARDLINAYLEDRLNERGGISLSK